MTISDVTVVEGNTGTVTAVFIVSLSSPSGSVVEVDYTTVGGSATALDFEPRQDTLTIAPGSTTGSISVAVIGDIVREPTRASGSTLRRRAARRCSMPAVWARNQR